MTTLGRSPPRSKKESFAADSVLTAGSIVADLKGDDVPTDVGGSVEDLPASEAAAAEPQLSHRELKAQAKATRRQKRQRAKQQARAEREQGKQRAAAAREQEAANEAAAREQVAEATAQAEDVGDTDASSGAVVGPEPQPVPPSEASIGLAERLEAERIRPGTERERLDTEERERLRGEEADAGAAEADVADRPDRKRAKQARLEAKQVARQQRNEDREKVATAEAQARADAAAAQAAERVDTRTAEMEAPELTEPAGLVEDGDLAADAAVVPTSDLRPAPEARHESEHPTELAIATAAAAVERNDEHERQRAEAQEQQRVAEEAARHERAEAKAARRRLRAEAKEAARREREDAKRAARRARDEAARPAHTETAAPVGSDAGGEVADDVSAPVGARQANADAKKAALREREQAKQAARQEREEARIAARSTKAARRAEKRTDHIVEAPREPKVSFFERLRQKAAAGEPGATPRGRNALAILAGIIGVLGLACSLVLAIGAFMAALGTTDSNRAYDVLSTICDVLVGPLRDLFSFSGTNADMKEAVVAWGAGSMIYVFVGMFAQSYLRSRGDDD